MSFYYVAVDFALYVSLNRDQVDWYAFKQLQTEHWHNIPYFCNFGRYTKIHISTLLSNFSQQASCFDVYAFMVVTMEKKGKLQLGYLVLLSFVIAQRCQIFRFWIAWSHARHLAATHIAIQLLLMNVMLDFICIGCDGLWGTGLKRKFIRKYKSPAGIEPATPRFATWRLRLGHHWYTTNWDNFAHTEISVKLQKNRFILLTYNSSICFISPCGFLLLYTYTAFFSTKQKDKYMYTRAYVFAWSTNTSIQRTKEACFAWKSYQFFNTDARALSANTVSSHYRLFVCSFPWMTIFFYFTIIDMNIEIDQLFR